MKKIILAAFTLTLLGAGAAEALTVHLGGHHHHRHCYIRHHHRICR
ncbi:MAG TPA: hypothetical protein VGC16_04215 [Rhizomicrobium sp.]